jgi:hypothetical protein
MHQSQHRYSPAAVVAVEREAVYGVPAQISTSYVERSHLTLRQSRKRFVRLGTGFSKKLENHAAAVSLYVAHYNLGHVHEGIEGHASGPAWYRRSCVVAGRVDRHRTCRRHTRPDRNRP